MAFFSSQPPHRPNHSVARLLLCLSLAWPIGCSRIISLPEVDLHDPQWTVWQGQALWTPRAGLTALAGDLIVARNPGGDVLVSFSKPPFPIFTAQTSGSLWRIDFIDKGRSYSGIGRPPRKFVWFRLPDLFEGAAPPKHWTAEERTEHGLLLINCKTGEKIRVVLDR